MSKFHVGDHVQGAPFYFDKAIITEVNEDEVYPRYRITWTSGDIPSDSIFWWEDDELEFDEDRTIKIPDIYVPYLDAN